MTDNNDTNAKLTALMQSFTRLVEASKPEDKPATTTAQDTVARVNASFDSFLSPKKPGE